MSAFLSLRSTRCTVSPGERSPRLRGCPQPLNKWFSLISALNPVFLPAKPAGQLAAAGFESERGRNRPTCSRDQRKEIAWSRELCGLGVCKIGASLDLG